MFSKGVEPLHRHRNEAALHPLCRQPNGSVLAMRLNQGHDPDSLTEPFENDTFTAPLNLMVVDRDGKAMRVVINRGEISYH